MNSKYVRIVPCFSTNHKGHRKMRVAARCDQRWQAKKAREEVSIEALQGDSPAEVR
jgi:hypothetical protein